MRDQQQTCKVCNQTQDPDEFYAGEDWCESCEYDARQRDNADGNTYYRRVGEGLVKAENYPLG